MQITNWQDKFSEFETKEEALIRMVNNDPTLYDEARSMHMRVHKILAGRFGVSTVAINKKIGKLRKQGRITGRFMQPGKPVVIVPTVADKKLADTKLPQDFLNLVIEGQKLITARDVRQEEVFPEYPFDGWVCLTIGGDWHFEHYKTNTKELIADLKFIGQEPHVLYGFNGDAIDVLDLRFLELENETVSIPVRRLYEIVEFLFTLVPNTLFVVLGCHDNWARTRARWDILEAIQSKILGYYLGFGGTINLKVGDITYRIGAYHKFGLESKLNNFHPCMNYLKQMDSDADIICVSHRHDIVGVCYTYIQGKPKVFMRSGSHQYKTEYAWKEGFRGAIARYPCVLLNGTEKRMIPVANFRDALPILRSLNSGKARDVKFFKGEGH